jgi:ubiquinone/menaquinone biosynthesis C-methylase UbiE
MRATDRLKSESAFHDKQARARAATFQARPDAMRFRDDDYVRHETWIAPALRELGDVRGRALLDYGCGHGMAAIVLARAGARVTAFDVSHGYLAEARTRASANNVAVSFVKGDGQALPFADCTFERIWGHAILHHLDLHRAAPELFRILQPGGIGVFCEPWAGNPFLDWARRQWKYRDKERTRDEEPLSQRHIALLRNHFPVIGVRGYQLLSMGRRVLRPGRLVAGLDWCDAMVLPRIRSLERFCRYVVITVRR